MIDRKIVLCVATGWLVLGSASGLPNQAGPEDSPEAFGFVEVAKLVPPDARSQFNWFGTSVVLRNDLAVIGAPNAPGWGREFTGAVYVFQRQHPASEGANRWELVAKLAPDNRDSDDFGTSVAFDGRTLVVGAPEETGNAHESGAAYVFERDPSRPGHWRQAARLLAADAGQGDRFGTSVAVSGDLALVGAHFHDLPGNTRAGAVYAFERSPSAAEPWSQVAKLLADEDSLYTEFGIAVSLQGSTAAVGAWLDGGNDGAAYVFERTAGAAEAWEQVAKLTANPSHVMATSLALGGDWLLVKEGGIYDPGSVHVFRRHGLGAWDPAVVLTPYDGRENDNFGKGVTLSGDTIAVGSPQTHGPEPHTGSVYVFKRNVGGPDAWGHVQEITSSDGDHGDLFGQSVDLDGDTLLVGAPSEGKHRGAVYVFSRERSTVSLRLREPFAAPGGEVKVRLTVVHRRPEKVRASLRVWIEDEGGRIVTEETTSALSFHPEARTHQELSLTLPSGIPSGRYRVFAGTGGTEMGVAGDEETLFVGPRSPDPR